VKAKKVLNFEVRKKRRMKGKKEKVLVVYF